jgi:hypothetical protein
MMIQFLKCSGIISTILIISFSLFSCRNIHDRNPGYELNLKVVPSGSGTLHAGFSAIPITPEVPDTWIDNDANAKYEPRKGDSYTDGNGNGKFDAVWIAGFSNKRAANGIHDQLWARTMVIDDGNTRFSLTAIDAIGLFHDELIDIRKRISNNAGITYSIVTSTHDHEAPDLMGLWGPKFYKSGVDAGYLEFVKNQIVSSIEDAAENLEPARIKFAQDLAGLSSLVTDTRAPFVMDDGLRIIQVLKMDSDTSIGTLIAWGCHPETLWDKNLMITSDFPHYVREGIEKGIYSNDNLIKTGIGGIALYFNGAIGGLMTVNTDWPIHDPWSGETYSVPDFDKAESQGMQIAFAALSALENSSDIHNSGSIGIAARTFNVPVKNFMFRLGARLGVMNRGYSKRKHMRTEVAYVTIGPASFLTYPGEVYPELINGGIESPVGQDYETEPLELPAAREMMSGGYKFIIGLGNDELGYFIPKSEWDKKKPYLYGAEESPYGESNSLGPDTAPILHEQIRQLIEDFNN